MARYHKKKHGSRGRKSIPVLPVLPALGAVMNAYSSAGGFNIKLINELSKNTVGIDVNTGKFSAAEAAPFWLGEGVAIVGHMVASKTGINNHIRRFTMGFLSL